MLVYGRVLGMPREPKPKHEIEDMILDALRVGHAEVASIVLVRVPDWTCNVVMDGASPTPISTAHQLLAELLRRYEVVE
jgi:hypothetical protein